MVRRSPSMSKVKRRVPMEIFLYAILQEKGKDKSVSDEHCRK